MLAQKTHQTELTVVEISKIVHGVAVHPLDLDL